MVNRYAGEIRINPIAILRNNDFNNDGEINDIDQVLSETLEINERTCERIGKIQSYLKQQGSKSGNAKFYFAEGGYIGMRGFTDEELLAMKSKGLIDLFDFAQDRDWVKKYGAQFGLVWEDGRAVRI